MHISKKNWGAVSFGDVAIQQKGDIDRESEAVNRFVAGEHMASEDLRIRQWGVLDGQYLGPAFRRKFEKGDILYGSRRTYLKKVAVAEFAGITANTTFVIKPNREKIFAGLLPFLMLSDSFTEHSIKHSKGSVNPYINWKDIANFTFKLPLMGEQERISKLLSSIGNVAESYIELLENMAIFKNAYFDDKYEDKTSDLLSISEIAEINPRLKQKNLLSDTLISFVAMADVSEEGCILQKADRAYGEVKNGLTPFEEGDILFAKITPCMENGKGAIALSLTNRIGFGSTEFHILRPKNSDDRDYLFYLTMMHSLRKKAEQLMTGSAGQKRVPSDFFDFYKVRFPEASKRKLIGQQMKSFDEKTVNIKENIAGVKTIQKQIINEIFG